MSAKLIKRMRRKVMGGLVTVRVYDDGTAKIRCDHPSNDPEIELQMVGRFIKGVRRARAELGIGEPDIDIGRWRSDP